MDKYFKSCSKINVNLLLFVVALTKYGHIIIDITYQFHDSRRFAGKRNQSYQICKICYSWCVLPPIKNLGNWGYFLKSMTFFHFVVILSPFPLGRSLHKNYIFGISKTWSISCKNVEEMLNLVSAIKIII